MSATPHAAHIAFLGAEPRLAPMASFALTAAVVITKWSQNARTRRALAQLDGHLLDDIGVDPRAARREARRMFWQD